MSSSWPARAMDDARNLIAVLKADQAHLQTEVDKLCKLLLSKLSCDNVVELITVNWVN